MRKVCKDENKFNALIDKFRAMNLRETSFADYGLPIAKYSTISTTNKDFFNFN